MAQNRLDQRVILVSGGARGMGESEARLFVNEGASVVIGDVRDDLGQRVADDLGDRAAFVQLDVTSEEDWSKAVAAAVERFGKLDGLVNNAGIQGAVGPLRDYPLAEYLTVTTVNQVGVFLGMRAVVPAMEAAGGGTIVNISSSAGMAGVAGTVAYTASKFAVRGMTKTAALELGPLGIRVNSVHPGGVKTPMTAAFWSSPSTADGEPGDADTPATDIAATQLALGRMAEPGEIARLVLFLTSDESSYCTGSEFIADGGQLAGFVYT